jgi:hypothetical protein
MNAMKPLPSRRSDRGYSLIELALATGILAAGVAAAASLTMSSVRIEEISHRNARVLALTEGAARMWQLGMSPSQIGSLLPGDPALVSISFNGVAGDPTSMVPTDQGSVIADPSTDLGTFQAMTIRATVSTLDGSSGPEASRELNPLTVVR